MLWEGGEGVSEVGEGGHCHVSRAALIVCMLQAGMGMGGRGRGLDTVMSAGLASKGDKRVLGGGPGGALFCHPGWHARGLGGLPYPVGACWREAVGQGGGGGDTVVSARLDCKAVGRLPHPSCACCSGLFVLPCWNQLVHADPGG